MRIGHDHLWLWVVLAVVLAVAAGTLVAGYFERRRRLRRLGSVRALGASLRSRAPGLRTIKGALFLLGLGGFLFALLRPQHGGREQLIRQYGLDVVVAVDFSKSMLAEDVAPSRIGRVRIEIARLLRELEGNRVGAVAFAGDAIAFPISTDVSLVNTFFRNFDPATLEPPGTAIGRAIRKSQLLLDEVNKPVEGAAGTAKPKDDRARIIIVFTDGEDQEGDPVAAARRAEEETGARVFVVQVGELGGTTIPIKDPLTGEITLHHTRSGEVATTEITPQMEDKLQEVASSRTASAPDSTDRYYRRLGAEGSVADAIEADIRKLRRSEMEARKVTLYDELYWVALLPAAALFAAEALLPAGWESRRRRRGEPGNRQQATGNGQRATGNGDEKR
ncbi:MAG: VWA domain-containing protein [Deltaproteobacteria bacterium]|nr:VWA domain-containing protein [Deltaproteobacteria bacterium]